MGLVLQAARVAAWGMQAWCWALPGERGERDGPLPCAGPRGNGTFPCCHGGLGKSPHSQRSKAWLKLLGLLTTVLSGSEITSDLTTK